MNQAEEEDLKDHSTKRVKKRENTFSTTSRIPLVYEELKYDYVVKRNGGVAVSYKVIVTGEKIMVTGDTSKIYHAQEEENDGNEINGGLRVKEYECP